ncbi:MAG: DUF5060 domain-containing protein [Cyclobacteriaceae bacterium]
MNSNTMLPHKIILVILFISITISRNVAQVISGEMKTWHKITLTLEGPETSEYDTLNPFLDYRMDVTFKNGSNEVIIPGFYAADGQAGETSAKSGNKWKVRFAPNIPGEWSYQISFRKGKNVSVSGDSSEGEAVSPDGITGRFSVVDTNKKGRDLRGKGRLLYNSSHYLAYERNQEPFIKGGANSPENLLGYYQFDQTPDKHRFEAHSADWKDGDPTWKNGKGKNLIGALNYLSSTGTNSVYFLTMNVMGDGKDVWPWIDDLERYRFDVSKLDQWEVVFDHMDKLGLVKHIITQETENECLLDIGQTGIQRKLYYRELVARFAHHPGLIWNMGEENGITNWSPIGQTNKLRLDMIKYMKNLDPYDNPVFIHTLPSQQDHENTMTGLLGSELDGVSFQIHHRQDAHKTIEKWRVKSEQAGKKWVLWIDEIGPAGKGTLPDSNPAQQDSVRKEVIWSSLLAGGSGVEHYFGYKAAHNDLNCEDWRSRDRIWKLTTNATSVFSKLPVHEMEPADELLDSENGHCFAKKGHHYMIYLESGGQAKLDLKDYSGKYKVMWFDPVKGGSLLKGKVKTLKGGTTASLGLPPYESNQDWVAQITKIK